MNSLTDLTPQQLRRAADLKERIDSLQTQLNELLDAPATAAPSTLPRRRRMSAAARARIAAAARARWARIKGAAGTPAKPKRHFRRKLSAAGRAALSLAAKARWRVARARGRTTL